MPGEGRGYLCVRPGDPRGLDQLQAALGHPAASLHQNQTPVRLRAVLAREHLRARRPPLPVLRRRLPTSELTFDHVVPVAHGGRKDWENIVTCCVQCNRRKGGRTPGEAGMHLLRAPRRPESTPAIRITVACATRRRAGATISTGTRNSTTRKPRARPRSVGDPRACLLPASLPLRRAANHWRPHRHPRLRVSRFARVARRQCRHAAGPHRVCLIV